MVLVIYMSESFSSGFWLVWPSSPPFWRRC